jgi:ankyrin repeat protein
MFKSKNEKLLDAVENGRLDLVKSLIDKGADINTRDFFKCTPLTLAARSGDTAIVQYLLGFPNTDIGALNFGGTTALMVAARQGHLDVIKVFLDDPRTDVNQLGKFGGTALMNAAGFGHIDIVRELLTVENISLDATYTEKKHSPLSIAQQNGHTEIAALLENFMASKVKPFTPKKPAL